MTDPPVAPNTPVFDSRSILAAPIGEPASDELRRALFVRARDAALRADMSGALARTDSLRGMLQHCAEALVRHLGVAFARIWTSNRSGDVLELQASAGLHTRIDGEHARIRIGELKIGRIARERVPHLTNLVLEDPRVHDKEWARREGLVAFAGYPLLIEEHVVGVMAMFARDPLLPDTLETLGSIASLIAHGIERKRSEDRLRRSEAYLAEGQRLSHTGSWAWRLDTGERFWSLEVYRIYGFEPADTPPPLEAVLQRVHPEDAAQVRVTVAEALQTHSEFRFRTRVLIDGETIKHVETIGHPVRDEDGRVVEFIGTDMDITESYRASRRLRRAIRARYAAVLAERTRIARDMHDGLLQDVTGICLQLAALLPQVRATSDAAAERLASILELTQRTSREARQAVLEMRSTRGDGDLVSAVEAAARRVVANAALSLSVTLKGPSRPVPAETRDAAVAIVQEATTNVVKHAHARTVAIGLSFTRTRIRLTIRDDGADCHGCRVATALILVSWECANGRARSARRFAYAARPDRVRWSASSCRAPGECRRGWRRAVRRSAPYASIRAPSPHAVCSSPRSSGGAAALWLLVVATATAVGARHSYTPGANAAPALTERLAGDRQSEHA